METTKPKAIPQIVRNYQELFVNRRAYTVQSLHPHPEAGRHYYFRPSQKGTDVPLMLTDSTIRQHLQGETTIGLYAISPSTQRCKRVAIDADYKNSMEVLLKLQYHLIQDGVEPALEMSKRGGHLWIFLATALLARECRISPSGVESALPLREAETVHSGRIIRRIRPLRRFSASHRPSNAFPHGQAEQFGRAGGDRGVSERLRRTSVHATHRRQNECRMPEVFEVKKKPRLIPWASVVHWVTKRLHCAQHDTSRWIEIRVGWISAALILGMVFFARPEFAFAQETYCPESISVYQTVERVPGGWTANQDELASTLAGIAFYSGPPEEKALLKYDRLTKRNGLEYAIWHFQPKSSQRIWLSCRYSFTRVVLVRQLPAETSECIVIYDPKVSVSGCSPDVRKLTCH